MSETEPQQGSKGGDGAPPHRYTAALAGEIELRWQRVWEERGVFRAPNPGEPGFDEARPKYYVLDMFPYPSGAGLHVGHPEGYTATDIVARYMRMNGRAVLHPMGWDAFGLPAEQYAIQTGVHPAETTRSAIDNFRRQLKRFGFSYDWSREVATIDEDYYRWTQWVFLKLYDAWYDAETDRARPIRELEEGLANGTYGVGASGEVVSLATSVGYSLGIAPALSSTAIGARRWAELDEEERRAFIDGQRLAYIGEQTVNWCPKLGTALANEEVIDGRSERGSYPVFRKPMRQWMFRITAYAERLLRDLELVEWPESTRAMQAEWIGRSEGAEIEFEIQGTPALRAGASARRAEVRATIEALEARRGRVLSPRGFAARDPYPPGEYGAARDLIASRRNLPHLSMPDATYFVSWRAVDGVRLDEEERAAALDALTHFDGERCRVFAATVMPDHIHWIVRPFDGHDLDSLVSSVKRYSARAINERRGASGNVWEPERFDHIVRSVDWFGEFLYYLVDNPVEAGLASAASAYAWTFVHPDVLWTPGESGADGSALRADSGSESRGTLSIRVYTTRPDTIFGATYMVVAPEHPVVEEALASGAAGAHAAALGAYAARAKNRSDVERQESKEKTGVFTGLYAINPATKKPIPVWAADYVLMGYGTGAIMAVPAHDERDHEFARKFGLPTPVVVEPADGPKPEECFAGAGVAVNSSNDEVSLDGLPTAEAKKRITEWLESKGLGARKVNYRLRDWLFSRQRYWGEPFPVVFDARGRHYPVSAAALPVKLPPLADYQPVESDDPVPLLAKATEWVNTTAGAAGVDPAVLPPETPVRRETNTMPGWAGSCWYYLRYCDPRNGERFVGREAESYWMGGGGVDLYIGGAEHAVLHLLYARFWHKVLFDLGEVSTPEPFKKLFHQGLITSYAYQRADKTLVPADQVEESGEGVFVERATGQRVTQVVAKMSKSLKNVVNPDDVIAEFGADTFRLYEMYMGPLEASKPWNTRDIAGPYRFLQRAWRLAVNEETGELKLSAAADEKIERQLHRTIAKVGADIERLAFNTAIAAMIEFVNAATAQDKGSGSLTRDQLDRFVRVLAPFAPHMAEELWSKLGGLNPISDAAWPAYDEAMLRESSVEYPVQVQGKVRGRVTVAAEADAKTIEAAALADAKVQEFIAGRAIKKVIVVPGKMVNVVV